MKRINNLVPQIANLDNLYLAFSKACKGKQWSREVLDFRSDFDRNIQQIRNELLSGDVSVGDYRYFTIHDPKERLICAAAFRERVVHHAIMNICHQYFDRQLIYDTYATRIGKGQYAALDRAMDALKRYKWICKLDFRKYYYTISHNILKQKLRHIFKDNTLLKIFDRIIDTYQVSDGLGLPIGNLTSQYFANYYLSSLDHYCKETIKMPVYIRYMDDILIAADSKNQIRNFVASIDGYSQEKLLLTLKPPIIHTSPQGMSFLGYRIMPYRYFLNGRSKRRFRTKLIEAEHNLQSGIWTEQEYIDHVEPLMAFVRHAQSIDFVRSCIKEII